MTKAWRAAGIDVDSYGLSETRAGTPVPAPDLPCRPADPRAYVPGIGLIGCGGISAHHLAAYRKAGYRVVALCDRTRDRAEPVAPGSVRRLPESVFSS